jgi:hypothetical protein
LESRKLKSQTQGHAHGTGLEGRSLMKWRLAPALLHRETANNGLAKPGDSAKVNCMQTTIQLDQTVLDQATRLAQENGCDLSQFIEETLRDRITPKPTVARQSLLRLTTVGGQGLRPGVDLDNSAALLTLMEQGA